MSIWQLIPKVTPLFDIRSMTIGPRIKTFAEKNHIYTQKQDINGRYMKINEITYETEECFTDKTSRLW